MTEQLKNKITEELKKKGVPEELSIKIAILQNSNVPQKVPAEFLKKLASWEVSRIKKVIAEHGDMISPRNLELLRSEHLIMKDGVIYRHDFGMKYLGEDPKKLTKAEITAELLDRAEDDRIQAMGEIPWWEAEGMTKEEYLARDKKLEHEQWLKDAPKRKVIADLTEAYGRPPTKKEVWEWMTDNETQEQRMDREYNEMMGWNSNDDPELSSYKRGGFKVRDKQVNKYIFYCITAYVFYTYHIVFYIVITLAIIIAIIQYIRAYVKIWKAARVAFVPDPRSRWSEVRQYELWLADRKRWKLDKDDNKGDRILDDRILDKADKDKADKEKADNDLKK